MHPINISRTTATRFGGFFFLPMYLPGVTERALYRISFKITQSELNCQMQIFDTKMFLHSKVF